jgi:dihydrofolate reductase
LGFSHNRKTYESLGKPLKGRDNIVISRQVDFKAEGIVVVHSLEDAIQQAYDLDAAEVFITGGTQIFELGLPLADRIYLTRVHAEPVGDAHFPVLSTDTWKRTFAEKHLADEKNQYNFTFETWERLI